MLNDGKWTPGRAPAEQSAQEKLSVLHIIDAIGIHVVVRLPAQGWGRKVAHSGTQAALKLW